MFYIDSIVIAIVTLALCIVFVLFIMKTQKVDKNKAIVALLGVIIEILIGIAFNYFFGDFPIPSRTPETAIAENNPEQNVNIEIINNDYNYTPNGLLLPTTIFTESESKSVVSNTTVPDIVQETSIPTVHLVFNEISNSLTDKNGEFKAFTSVKAEKVTLYCEVDGVFYDEFEMETRDTKSWTFDACFFEPNTYVLTAVAECSMGEVRSNPIIVKYPF